MLWFDEKVYLMYIFALCMNKELLDNCAWATLKNVVMNIDFNFLRQTKKLLYMAHFLFVEWREPKYLTVGNRFGHANQFWHTAAQNPTNKTKIWKTLHIMLITFYTNVSVVGKMRIKLFGVGYFFFLTT